jgi:TetR/AcrR family transcriptional repressor of uid operon
MPSLAVVAYPSRARRRLATRERLFEAALAEFQRVGVGDAEVERIVRAAGVARGTFYLHYPTKDHVLLELLRRRQAVLAARLRERIDARPRAFLRAAAVLLAADAADQDRRLAHELLAVVARHAAVMRTEASALVEVVTAFFAAAQERGAVRADVSAFDLTAVFLPGVYGLLQMKLDDPPADVRRALDRVVDVFVRGIVPARRWRRT